MRDIVRTNQLKKDYKRARKRGLSEDKFVEVLMLLEEDQ